MSDDEGGVDLSGRVAVVTGAGAGLGRAEALALARAGADIVVNDVNARADEVVAQVEALGRRAIAVIGDVGSWAMGEQLVAAAVDGLGGLDIVVNNAGITRDSMLFNLSEQDWDDVLRVNLKGHAALGRAALIHWREKSKRAGGPVYARVVNTSSEAFLFGPPGQPNYGAAKAGVTALTLSIARGGSRYGVTSNAICPRARTEMTTEVFVDAEAVGQAAELFSPDRVAEFAAYLSSPAAAGISGQVFVVYADLVALMAAPTVEHVFRSPGGRFDPAELAGQLTPYFRQRPATRTFAAADVASLDTTGQQR